MDTPFQARYEIIGSEDLGNGIFRVYGDVVDYSIKGWGPWDAVVGDLVFDEDLLYGVSNCYRIIEIESVGPGTSLVTKVIYNEEGDIPGTGQPNACSGIICRISGDWQLPYPPSVSYTQISESILNAMRNYQNSKMQNNLDDIVKNNTFPSIPFFEGSNPPLMTEVDQLGLDDVAAFESGVVQDVVFRSPTIIGRNNGLSVYLRFFLSGTVSNHVKLKLDYWPISMGDAPDYNNHYELYHVIDPMPNESVVSIIPAFVIPQNNIPSFTSWINHKLSRLGDDNDDGYPGQFCLMDIIMKVT